MKKALRISVWMRLVAVTTRTEQLVTILCQRMTTLTRTLATWIQDQPHSLAETEQHVVRLLKEAKP